MLNIAKTIYAAWDPGAAQKYELSEAEVIPLGESINEKKKLNTITKKYPSLQEHDNIPLPGFTLYKTDRKNWGSVDQTWLVIDPRGFLVRIQSKNLESILLVTGITEGLIQEKCVWARDNTETKMTLVPVSDDRYIEAVKNTELLECKVDMKDVQIGDTVLLQNKLIGIYMGVMSLYSNLNTYSSSNRYSPERYLRREVIEVSPGLYFHQADSKILKVIKKTNEPLTREQTVEIINQKISDGTAHFSINSSIITGSSILDEIKLVSIHAIQRVPMTFEEIRLHEVSALFNRALGNGDIGILLLERSNGEKYILDLPYFSLFASSVSLNSFDVSRLYPGTLDTSQKIERILLLERRKSLWNQGFSNMGLESIDNFTKFYKIVKHVKDKTYI